MPLARSRRYAVSIAADELHRTPKNSGCASRSEKVFAPWWVEGVAFVGAFGR